MGVANSNNSCNDVMHKAPYGLNFLWRNGLIWVILSSKMVMIMNDGRRGGRKGKGRGREGRGNHFKHCQKVQIKYISGHYKLHIAGADTVDAILAVADIVDTILDGAQAIDTVLG